MNVKKCVRALLCLYLTLIIAMDAVKAQALKVGDTLPPELWSMPLDVINHPEGKDCITLEDYKDKLIILDFWATWCAPCIKSLTKLDTLQSEFGEQLAVIPITYENADKVLPFLTKRGYQLPSVINDSTLKKYFPHRSIPHQVWVRAGEVLAVTGAEYANHHNVERALRGEDFVLGPDQKYVAFDFKLPLFYNNNGGFIEEARLRSVFSKRLNADVGGTKLSHNGILIYNASFSSIVYEMYSNHVPFWGSESRMVWEVGDSLKHLLLGTNKRITGLYENDIDFYKWLKEYTYCYELKLDSSLFNSRNQLLEFMRDDLNRYWTLELGIKTSVEKRPVECYTLVAIGDNQASPIDLSEPGMSEKFYTLSEKPAKRLAGYLSYVLHKHPYPVIDQTPAGTLISIKLEKRKLSIDEIKKELNNVGLDLVLQIHEIDVIVIEDNEPHLTLKNQ